MKVYGTRHEIESLIGSSTVGWIGFTKKSDASQLHAGHEYIVNYSKTNFEKTVVVFWDMVEIMDTLYHREAPFLAEQIISSWDSTGCLSWCELQGVDYVLMAEPGYSQEYFDTVGIKNQTSTDVFVWVDQVWLDNSYPIYIIEDNDTSRYSQTLRAKSFAITQKNKPALDMTYVSCWDDGEPRFVMKDYIENHMPENDKYVLLDPIKDGDGLYYSSSYSSFTEDQRNLLKQIEVVVDSTGYEDISVLTSALEALNTGSEDFTVSRIDVTNGGVVGEANDFISIYFDMGGTRSSYPIYKKGVR